MLATMLGSIPSPSFNTIDIGPLSLNLYGLMIALGVVAAVWLFQLVFSHLWIRMYTIGPFEWLWRSAVKWRWQKFERVKAS